MKKSVLFIVFTVLTLFAVNTALAGKAECPQKRKTKKAPSSLYTKDKTAKADAKNGKAIFEKKAKKTAKLFSRKKPSRWPAKCVMVTKVTAPVNWVRL
jgi:hypothetical protein